ncbi:MAG: PspA/IM30 family protein [Chloroflexi bacterium]|nr:PspA/IM30 family protein [Chloroflexota bacterium]
MATLLEKVQTLIAANLHSLVDEALKMNSLAVIDEYIRQVEHNLDDLEDATATVGGEVKTLKRKQDEFAGKVSELDNNIDLLLKESKEALAVAAQSKLNSTQRLAESYQQQYQRQQAEYQKLLDAKLKLEAKLTTVKQERDEMQALLDLARSKEVTTRTVQSLDNLVGSGDQDIARMADSIRSRLDKASAHAEMQATRLDAQMDDVLERHTLDAQLAERKKKLGLA